MGDGWKYEESSVNDMKDRLAIISIVAVGLLLYGLTLHGVWGNPGPSEILGKLDQTSKPFELSPERGRYSHIYSMAEDHTYELSAAWARVVYPDVGVYNGKFYSFFAPGVSYMAVPFYLLGRDYDLGQVFSFAMIALFSIAALICLYKICRNIFNLPIWASLFSAFVFGFVSTAWSYAVTLYQHHVMVFFMLFAFYSTWKFSKRGKWSFMWAIFVGLSYGLAIFIDYPNAILIFPVMVYFISTVLSVAFSEHNFKISIRWVGSVALAAFMIITCIQFYHNDRYYGSWKNLAGGIPSYHLPEKNATSTPAVKEDSKDVVGFFTEEHIPMSFYTLIFSTDRGLLFFCPVFLLAFIGIYIIRKKLATEHVVLIWLVIVNVFLYSSWGDPWGGWAFGPRYLIPSMAVLSIFIAIFLAEKPQVLPKRIAAFILGLYGIFVALIGVLTTNAIPTYVEGIFLPAKKYNYLLNLDFIKHGMSDSFIFNNYFSRTMSLARYAVLIYIFLVILLSVILFVLPKFSNQNDNG